MKGLDSTDLGSSWVVRSSMMDKDINNLTSHQSDHFTPLDYSRNHNHHNPNDPRPHQTTPENGIEMVDYRLCNPSPQPQISLDKLSFTDVMQFADFGPKLALHNSKVPGDDDESSYFLRQQEALMPPLPPLPHLPQPRELDGEEGEQEEDEIMFSESNDGRPSVQFLHGVQKSAAGVMEVKNRRKRPRSLKTTEEVESQRMTHIAVERNRRRQMNDHLRLLRSLMPGSYVQRGDQASIVGGAIEFVRELEQLLQCLESQKRRRLFGGSEPPRAIQVDPSTLPNHQPFFPPLPSGVNDHHMKILELDPNDLIEEMAENKSCLADIEVRLLGCDAMIKILCRKRAGQLLKIVTALEESQFNILHTNVTTIELTVLYSFNVKITAETRYSAEDIAILVEQILSFIDAGTL